MISEDVLVKLFGQNSGCFATILWDSNGVEHFVAKNNRVDVDDGVVKVYNDSSCPLLLKVVNANHIVSAETVR